MNLNYKSILFIGLSGAILLAGCSNPSATGDTTVEVSADQSGKVTVSDPDGLKTIVGLLRIPTDGDYREEDIDFMFDKPGAKSYAIQLGTVLNLHGTVLHVEVTDLSGNESFHFLRSTPQGIQTGTFSKK